MGLWKLSRKEDIPMADDPWEPPYNKTLNLIVRADTEEHARRLAQEESNGEEITNADAWLDPNLSTCEEVPFEGKPGIILENNYGDG